MQFTNRRGHGTYSSVVRRYPAAGLDPNFESGATNLLNAMKAAACLLDFNLASMRADIRRAYRANPEVLGIFPVAAYNGGPRNVTKLYRVLTRMKVKLDELPTPLKAEGRDEVFVGRIRRDRILRREEVRISPIERQRFLAEVMSDTLGYGPLDAPLADETRASSVN